jgi:mono/diheme cytochrome c family protein
MPKWLVSAVGLSLFALPQGVAAQQGGDSAAGKAIYTKNCASCHSADGAPKDAIAKLLKVEMRHLGSAEVQSKSDEVLSKEISEGVGKMKPVKGLQDTDMVNLIAFVRTLKQ